MPPRSSFWLPIAGLLLPIALGLGWVLLRLGPMGKVSVPVPQTYWVEESQTYGVEEIVRLPPRSWRVAAPRTSLSGWAGHAVWVRLELKNVGDQAEAGILYDAYRFTDRLDLWVPQAGGWNHLVSGELPKPAEKAIPGRDVAFPVTLPPHSTLVVYLRLQNKSAIFCWPEWCASEATYFVARSQSMLAEGIYFGIMLALLGYNLLLWIRLKIIGLGWYTFYLGGMATFLLLARLIPQELGLSLSSVDLVVALSASAAICTTALVQFARRFLELRQSSPRADRIAIGLMIAQAGVLVGSFITIYWPTSYELALASVSTAATHVILLIIGVVAWRAGVWQARFFVLSFSCLFVGSLLNITTWWERSVGTADSLLSLMLGSALEMLLLSLAVAERFAQAQQNAVLIQEKLAIEAGQRQLIEETYAEELEIEVRERTKDLEAANSEKDRMLSVIGHDLRGPLAGLMREADDEPGQFARSTAQIGRELLLLIEDLVLWARLGAGSRVLAVHPARNVLAPAVALHNALAERGGTELVVEAAESLYVETDLVLTQTLVRNLLANALKFARSRVVLRSEGNDGYVRFSVTNDGPPLSPEVAARIAADESGPLTASGGLGLRLCREICRTQGLKLEARSSAELGTEFSFSVKAALGSPALTT